MKRKMHILLFLLAAFFGHAQTYETKEAWEAGLRGLSGKDLMKKQFEQSFSERERMECYKNDRSSMKDSLYDRILFVFDSVHTLMSGDDRIDSIWKFIRPRMVLTTLREADSVFAYRMLHGELPIDSFTIIRILPVVKGEWAFFASQQEFEGVFGFYYPRQGLIAIHFKGSCGFWDLARTIYHEGYHALITYLGYKYSDEHTLIKTLENDITVRQEWWENKNQKR